MILLDTGLNVLNLNKYLKEIETETFVPVSVSQYRTYIYESLAQDKLPSLEYYRYKLSKDALDLLYGISYKFPQKDKPLFFAGEYSLEDLDLPNLEFIYAQRNVDDISTIVNDVEVVEENHHILEENCFTNSENDDNVFQEEENLQQFVENSDEFDSFFNMQQDLPTKNPYFSSYSDVFSQPSIEDTPETRTTSTWNAMASTYGKKVDNSELVTNKNSDSSNPTEYDMLQQSIVDTVQSTTTSSDNVLQPSNPPYSSAAIQNSVVDTQEIPTDIRKFLKMYPNSEIDFVLKYFSKKDIDRALRLGKILRKGTKLHI